MACGNLYLLLLILFGHSLNVNGHLSPYFYSSTCPNALSIVKQGIAKAIKNEARVGASLLRLHFHDCFVNGCDGSILLDDTSTFKSEKSANPNKNSARGFGVVDNIKASLEKACPGVVSCADILAIAARDAVVHYGGPTWKVRLGRRDSLTANRSAANAFIPQPKFNLSNLTSSFAAVGLSFKDMVVLSVNNNDEGANEPDYTYEFGHRISDTNIIRMILLKGRGITLSAHTVGFARCTSFRPHIYNDTNIDLAFAKSLRQRCPRNGSDNVLQPLDYQTRFRFDDKYYQNLLVKKGLLHSDQQLYNGNKADCFTKKYAMKQGVFFKDFAKSMISMGNIKPLTGSNGEIRCNCRKPN